LSVHQGIRPEAVEAQEAARAPPSALAPVGAAGPTPDYLLAALLMAGAMACFVTLDIILKVLAQQHSLGMLITVRNLVQVVILAAVAPVLGIPLLRPRRPWLHFARGLVLVTSAFLITLALTYHPLAQSYAITLGAPIVASTVAALFLGERAGLRSWICIAGGFLGVLVALDAFAMRFAWTLLFPLGMAFSNGIFHVLTRLGRDESPATLVFWAATMALVVGVILLPWTYEALPLDVLAILAGGGMIGTLGHLMLAAAFRRAPTAFVSPILYSQIIWGALIGVVLFGESVELHVVVGAMLVAASGIALARWAAPRC